MNECDWLHIIGSGAIAAFSAFVLRIFLSRWRLPSSDSIYHRLLVRELRANSGRMPNKIRQFLLDKRQSYPWLYHRVLAFWPEVALERRPELPSAVIDVVHVFLVVLLSARVAAVLGAGPVGCGLAAIVAGICFATSPALLAVGIGPRSYEITARPFGELLVTICLASTGEWLYTDHSVWLVLGVVAGASAMMASKFALQVLVFFLPVLGLAMGRNELLLLIPAQLLTALLLSRGRYLHVLIGQLSHLHFYATKLQWRFSLLQSRNNLGLLCRAIAGLVRTGGQDRNAQRALALAFEQNTFLQMILRNVILYGVIVVFLIRTGGNIGAEAANGSWTKYLLAWVVASLVAWFATSFRPLYFLGEAERYPEYAWGAASVLFGLLALTDPDMMLVFASLHLLTLMSVVAYMAIRYRFALAALKQELIRQDDLINYLNQLQHEQVVLPIPMAGLGFDIAFRTTHNVLLATDCQVWNRYGDKIFAQDGRYPYPNENIDWWRQTHGMNLMVIRKAYLAPERHPPSYPTTGLTVCYENLDYVVWAVAEGQTSPTAGAH